MLFGPYCNYSCANCPGNPGFCDNEGICDDKQNLCDNSSFYGDDCSVLCSLGKDNCKRCDRNHICLECFNEEMFGPNCNESCENCPGTGEDGKCDIEGVCYDNETDCDNNKLTGPKCDRLCNENIDNCLTCDRKNICHECINRTWFGPYCNYSCANCPGSPGYCNNDGVCDEQTKECDDDQLTGPNCDIPCNEIYNNTLRCKRDNTSIECIDKSFYGPYCNESCENCPSEIETEKCHVNGTCFDQKNNCVNDTLTGEKCDRLCNVRRDNCYRCDRNNTCLECEKKNRYGDFCQTPCEKCPDSNFTDNKCHIDGICIDQISNCDNDFYRGEKCETPCGNCKRCNRNKTCIECWDSNHHGEDCSAVCSGCSETGCDIQGYCKDFKCKNGTYGLKCDTNCTCKSNSDSINCGKYQGQCVSCKFGYYGKDCDQYCNYKCHDELCCLFKDFDKDIKSKLEFTTNYKYLEVKYEDITYNIEIDYNYGYPLTLFKYNGTQNLKADKYEEELIINFTNYNVNGTLKKNQVIYLANKIVNNAQVIISDINSVDNKTDMSEIDGVIGLGFFNSISNVYFPGDKTTVQLNILSYAFEEDDNIRLNFGQMHKDQIDYVDKLTSCQVELRNDTDIQGKKMTCKLDGIKSATYTDYYILDNAYITFSIAEESSFNLINNKKNRDYLMNAYFKEDAEYINGSLIGSPISYFLYPKDKINRLTNFGFAFNNYFYSYSPKQFFVDSEISSKKRFIFDLRDDIDKTDFIIGKDFLKKIKFTINNEEAKIYFYAKNAEYSDKFTSEVNDNTFVLNLDAKESAAVSLSIIIFINLLVFSIFYCVKRRKMMNSGDYSRLE